jgi:hypothetical protein
MEQQRRQGMINEQKRQMEIRRVAQEVEVRRLRGMYPLITSRSVKQDRY